MYEKVFILALENKERTPKTELGDSSKYAISSSLKVDSVFNVVPNYCKGCWAKYIFNYLF